MKYLEWFATFFTILSVYQLTNGLMYAGATTGIISAIAWLIVAYYNSLNGLLVLQLILLLNFIRVFL